MRVQFRAKFFDLLNHANFGQPGIIVGTPAFGCLVSTRFASGETGSSRQLQFAFKLMPYNRRSRLELAELNAF